MLTLLLLALQGAPQSGDAVMAAAKRAVATLGDTAAVRAAGYRPITEQRIPDGLPFQGWHWRRVQPGDTLPDVGLDRPAFIMFAPVNGVPQRIGIAYSAALLLEAPEPPGLGGDASAKWHNHYWCSGVPEVPGGFLVNEKAQCDARGGTLEPRRTAMVHVWTDVPNPEGQYGNDNPALPYVAVGLTPPAVHDYMHDPARHRAVRTLGLALAETYGSRMPVANRVQRETRDSALVDSVVARRAAITALVPAMKQAQAAGDRAAYDRLAARAGAEWEALLELYKRMAPTPQLQAQVGRAHERVLTVSAHH